MKIITQLSIFALLALPALSQPAWVEKTSTAQTCEPTCTTQVPQFRTWQQLGGDYDPVSQSVLMYLAPQGPGGGGRIYSGDMYAYKTATNKFIHIVGTGSVVNACVPSTPTMPNNRHPEQTAVDTKRGLYWIVGGLNGSCPGGLPTDMFYLTLNADPTLDTWTKVTPAGGIYPDNVTQASNDTSAMVYDSDHDMLLVLGPNAGNALHLWRYCSTVPIGGGAPTGVLNAQQNGLCTADTWTQDTSSMIGSVPSAQVAYPGIVYAPNVQRMILYGSVSGSCPGSGTSSSLCTSTNSTYTYNPVNKTWVLLNPTNPPPAFGWQTGGAAVAAGTTYACGTCFANPPLVYNPATGHVMFHQDTNTGAPADWELDLTANSGDGGWTRTATGVVPNGGTSNVGWSLLGLDQSTNTLIMTYTDDNAHSNAPHIWQGVLPGTIAVPVVSQEAIYTGSTAGVARSNAPVTFTVPFADSDAIPVDGHTLGILGASVGQFRSLGAWPSGNSHYMQVDTQVSFAAGSSATVTVTNTGSGKFGGSDICTNGATTISCNTGVATFTIKKGNFNGIDNLVTGGKTVITSSNADNHGFVILGPVSPGTTCPCPMVYNSGNDNLSTSVIEENGPARAVVRSIADLKDSGGNIYQHITVRQYFYKGLTRVRTVPVLRDADYGVSGSFASAFKQHKGFEYRLPFTPGTGGNLTATFANETATPTTVSLAGSNYAYLYVGETQTMNEPDWCAQLTGHQTCVPFTHDIGYSVVNDLGAGAVTLRGGGSVITAISATNPAVVTLTGSALLNTLVPGASFRVTGAAGTGCTTLNTVAPAENGPIGYTVTSINGQNITINYNATGCTYTPSSATAWSDTQYPQGWGDIKSSDGTGVSIGVYQLSGYGSKSLEFRNGGTDIRIGIWAAENSQSYTTTYPGWQISDLWTDFHATAPASVANNFLSYQHYLLGRADVSWYNHASTFTYPMPTAAQEDATYLAAQQAENLPASKTLIASATNTAPITVGFTPISLPGFTATPTWKTPSDAINAKMCISGATGNTAINNTTTCWPVIKSDATHYTLTGSDGISAGAYNTNSGSAYITNILTPGSACCLFDRGLNNVLGYHLSRYYFYSWSAGSGTNQATLRLGDMQAFLKRGGSTGCLNGSGVLQTCSADGLGSHFAGRWLDAAHFYRFIAETAWPHADGFTWRSKITDNVLGPCGQPTNITSLNSAPGIAGTTTAMQLWKYCEDMHEHFHTSDLIDYYHLTGDETIKEAMVGFPTSASGGLKDLFLTLPSRQAGYYGKGQNGTKAATTANTVTLSGGETFLPPAGAMVDYPLIVNNVVYTVTAYISNTQVTVTPNPGVQAGPLVWAYDGGLSNTRSVGAFLMWSARFGKFLAEIGDSDSAAVLNQGERAFDMQVKPDICVSDGAGGTLPVGCVIGATNFAAINSQTYGQGVSRVRGWHFGNDGSPAQVNCQATTGPLQAGRGWSLLYNNNLAQGIWEFANVKGTGWSDYWTARDLVTGITDAMLGEGFAYDGTNAWFNWGSSYTGTGANSWTSNGFRFSLFTDYPNLCDNDQQGYEGSGAQTIWFPFYFRAQQQGSVSTLDLTKFNIALQRMYGSNSTVKWSEYGNYNTGFAIYAVNNPSINSFQSLTPTITPLGGGQYTVAWVVPPGTVAPLRVKYGCLKSNCADGKKTIVDSIGFDSGTNTFIGDPINTINWFAAQNVTSIPAPIIGSQSMTVTTGLNGMTAANFSVRAMIPGSTVLIQPSAHPATTIGVTYSTSLATQVSGGILPYTYALVSGALPTGTSLNTSTGAITGTVSGSAGVKTFTWSATDSAGSPVTATSASETITVNAAMTISTSAALTATTYGTAFTQTLVATGGSAPFTWSVLTGSLPPGVSLSSAGAVNGTPTAIGQKFSFTAKILDFAGASATKAFTINVNPLFSFGHNSIPAANTGCSHVNSIYAPLDYERCPVTGEVPLGTFAIPAVGSSYIDPNFGTPITIMSRNDTQGPSITSYATPSAWSATGRYIGIAVNTATVIMDPTDGHVVRGPSSSPPAPGFITGDTIQWDKTNDDYYYYFSSPAKLMRGSVSTGLATLRIDFTTLGLGITNVATNPHGDLSNGNWLGCFSNGSGAKLTIAVNLNNLRVYTIDSTILHNGFTSMGLLGKGTPNNGTVIVSKGIDSVSLKRYVLAVTYPIVIYSLNAAGEAATSPCGAFQCGSLTYERLGPEYPKSFRAGGGNDNNICQPTEDCIGVQHNDMFQDKTGQQYLATMLDGDNLIGSSFRGMVYIRMNADDLMLRSSAFESGGRTDLPIWYSQAVAGDPYEDVHLGCASGNNAAYCVASPYPAPERTAGDLTSAYVNTGHFGVEIVIKGVGEEVRQLTKSRTISWAGSSGNISSINCASGLCTVVTTAPHKLPPNNLAGTCIDGTGISAVDLATAGQCFNTQNVNATTFTLARSVTASSSTGTFTLPYPYQYWPHPFASISSDGSRIVYNTNFGYYTADGNENVVVAPTGFSPATLAISPLISLPATTVGAGYSQSVSSSATGGTPPYSWSFFSGTPPTGITISAGGSISGTVGGSAGVFTPTIRLTDSAVPPDHVDQVVSIQVNARPVITTTSPLPSATVPTVYSVQLTATGGTGALTWSVVGGALVPAGLSLSSLGLIGGTPSIAGTYNFTVQVTDTLGSTATQALTLVIASVAPGTISAKIVLAMDTKVVVQYPAPDYGVCTAAAYSDPGYTSASLIESVTDTGGSRLRNIVLGATNPLPIATTVYVGVTCSTAAGTVSTTTRPIITPVARVYRFNIPTALVGPGGPLNGIAADALIEYGPTPALGSVATASAFTSWQVTIPADSGSIVYYRICLRSTASGACSTSNPNLISGIGQTLFQGVL